MVLTQPVQGDWLHSSGNMERTPMRVRVHVRVRGGIRI